MERDKLLGTMDAKVWTDEFMATKARLGDEEFDHAMMLAWFANAIMAGFDEANRRAQRALDAAQARVKELELYLTQERANRDSLAACVDRDVKKIKELQAQLADRDAMILQMGEQAAVLAKENMAVKAQLRQVEGDAETYRKMHAVCTMNLALANNDLTTLRQLVEALPVVDGRMDVECGACYYIRSFVAEQYGVVCGLITEQATAMAIKALLEYRAVLAAQDPPHPTEEQS